MPDLEQELKNAYSVSREFTRYGEVASYIPELATKDSTRLGAAICTLDGRRYEVGDCGDRFTLAREDRMNVIRVCPFSETYPLRFWGYR